MDRTVHLRPDREDVCRAMLQHWPFTPELVWKLRYWLPYVEPLSWKKNGVGVQPLTREGRSWESLGTLARNPDATRLE